MGWCSGTYIMTDFINKMMKSERFKNDIEARKEAYSFLFEALEDGDWDCQSDALEIDLAFDAVFQKKYPKWYEDLDLPPIIEGEKAPVKEKAKKKNRLEKGKEAALEMLKFILDANTKINIFPIFAWGRYYKYECAGESFESDDIDCFASFESYSIQGVKAKWLSDADDLLESHVPNEEERNLFFSKFCSLIKRDWVRNTFDDRGGMALVIIRDKETGNYSFDYVDADSPE